MSITVGEVSIGYGKVWQLLCGLIPAGVIMYIFSFCKVSNFLKCGERKYAQKAVMVT